MTPVIIFIWIGTNITASDRMFRTRVSEIQQADLVWIASYAVTGSNVIKDIDFDAQFFGQFFHFGRQLSIQGGLIHTCLPSNTLTDESRKAGKIECIPNHKLLRSQP